MGITIDGLVSGLDTTGIITKLVELEKRPISLLENKQIGVNSELTAWQDINTKLLAFETAAESINTSGEFEAMTGSFTNDIALDDDIVSLTPNSNVSEGSYSLTVNQLATQNKVSMDDGFTSITANLGTFVTTITAASGAVITFQETTLGGLRDAINNSSALGVTASIINSSSTGTPNYRLQLISNGFGAQSGFSVSAVQAFGRSYDFTTNQTAQDAEFVFDGITITRASNSFTDVIAGVNMELLKTGSGTAKITGDTDAMVSNIESFITSYNTVMGFISEQFEFNPEEGDTRPLFGNSTLLGIQTKLRSIISSLVSGASGDYGSLSQIGITTDSSYQLSVDTTILAQAIRDNLTSVKDLFVMSGSGTYTFVTGSGATIGGTYDTRVIADGSGNPVLQMRLSGSSGSWITLSQKGNFWVGAAGSDMEGLTLRATNLTVGDTGSMRIASGVAERTAYEVGYITEFSTEGAIYLERRHLEDSVENYQEEIDDLSERVKIKQDSLVRKFAQLEVTLAQLKGQSDYLSQQLASLPGFNGTKS